MHNRGFARRSSDTFTPGLGLYFSKPGKYLCQIKVIISTWLVPNAFNLCRRIRNHCMPQAIVPACNRLSRGNSQIGMNPTSYVSNNGCFKVDTLHLLNVLKFELLSNHASRRISIGCRFSGTTFFSSCSDWDPKSRKKRPAGIRHKRQTGPEDFITKFWIFNGWEFSQLVPDADILSLPVCVPCFFSVACFDG